MRKATFREYQLKKVDVTYVLHKWYFSLYLLKQVLCIRASAAFWAIRWQDMHSRSTRCVDSSASIQDNSRWNLFRFNHSPFTRNVASTLLLHSLYVPTSALAEEKPWNAGFMSRVLLKRNYSLNGANSARILVGRVKCFYHERPWCTTSIYLHLLY